MEKEFIDWYKENETRFSHGQFDEKQIAYSAYIEGKKQALNLTDVDNERELLIAYGEWIHELAGCKDTEKATTLADSYLSNL